MFSECASAEVVVEVRLQDLDHAAAALVHQLVRACNTAISRCRQTNNNFHAGKTTTNNDDASYGGFATMRDKDFGKSTARTTTTN